MEASVLAYFFAVIVDIVVIIIFGFIKYVRIVKKEKLRPVIWAFIVWLFCNLVRNLLIIFSAGENALLNRGEIVWMIRWAVAEEHLVLLIVGILFFIENTTVDSPAPSMSIPRPLKKLFSLWTKTPATTKLSEDATVEEIKT